MLLMSAIRRVCFVFLFLLFVQMKKMFWFFNVTSHATSVNSLSLSELRGHQFWKCEKGKRKLSEPLDCNTS